MNYSVKKKDIEELQRQIADRIMARSPLEAKLAAQEHDKYNWSDNPPQTVDDLRYPQYREHWNNCGECQIYIIDQTLMSLEKAEKNERN